MPRLILLIFVSAISLPAAAAPPRNRAGLDLFEKKIRPALIQYCYECHAADSDDVGGELLLDSRAAVLAGGETGPAVVPGKPRDSLLMRAIEYRDLEMPPDEKLPDNVIADFRRWIALGAPDPRTGKPAATEQEQPRQPVDLWSFQPVVDPAVPAIQSDWPRTDVDRFVLTKLQQQNLTPNPDAEAAALIRRVYFDLIGLPPSPEEVADFVADPSEEHLQSIVDRLLCSSQFGQRWGRHWLDIARYGESAGSSRDVLMLYAWRYRDYVIDSLNDDVPFDQFVTEQLAGDLLSADTPSERQRQTIATGLLAIGSKSLNGGNLTYDVIDDQIDVVCKAVLGLTVSCARCHDHKFDPIPTKDYYSLAGFFLSTDTRYGGSTKRPKSAKEKSAVYLTLGPELDPQAAQTLEETQKKIDQLRKQVASSNNRIKSLEPKVPAEYRGDAKKELQLAQDLKPQSAKLIRQYQGALRILDQRKADLAAAEKQLGPEPEYAIGVRDAKKIADAKVLIRGEKGQPGEDAPRGFLSGIDDFADLNSSECGPIDSSQSGRRQLAHWLVHPQNPLTPRVAVNRIWQHLMGSGIVSTVDNFGINGTPPSHPELLDHLAHRFVHVHHWSTKAMIRELILSRTYRMSSDFSEAAYTADPDNRLRWRMPRRRLEAEQLRDAMLAVAGLLRTEPLKGSLVMQIGEGEVGRNINTSVLEQPFDYRSVYLPIIRGIIPEELRLFDFPEPSNVQGLRDANTTATQSLFLMNSRFAIRVAEHFADRLIADESLDSDADRAIAAYRRCFGVSPSEAEIGRATDFLSGMKNTAAKNRKRSGEGLAPSFDESPEGLTRSFDRFALAAYCQSLVASARFRFID